MHVHGSLLSSHKTTRGTVVSRLNAQKNSKCSSRAKVLLMCMRPSALTRAPGQRLQPQLNPLLVQECEVSVDNDKLQGQVLDL